MKLSVSGTTQERPRHWDNRVSAAYFRMCGFTQREAAEAAGVSERTIRNYEAHPSFCEAKNEARNRWFVSLDVRARAALFNGLGEKGKGDLGLKVLERLDPRLAPPNQRYEHSGVDGSPIDTKRVHVYIPENGRDRVSTGNSNRAPGEAGSASRNGC